MRVAICDDEKFFRDTLKDELYKYAKEFAIDFVYTEFSSGELLLASNIDFDLIFGMVANGVLGEIVNVQTQNNDIVRVVVEK